MAGLLHLRQREDPQRHATAARLFQRACQGGWGEACSNLGNLTRWGQGVAKDPEEARRLYQLYRKGASRGSVSAKLNLAVSLLAGVGGPKNEARARALFRSLCRGGVQLGCYPQGDIYPYGRGVPRDAAKAGHFFDKACQAGVQDACARLRAVGR